MVKHGKGRTYARYAPYVRAASRIYEAAQRYGNVRHRVNRGMAAVGITAGSAGRAGGRARTTRRPAMARGSRKYATLGTLSRFKRPNRRPRVDQHALRGSVHKIEDRGILSGANALYIGVCDSPADKVVAQASRAIIKELMRQAGQDFESWNRVMFVGASQLQLSYTYYPHAESTGFTQVNLAVASGSTYNAIAELLEQSWIATFTGDTDHIIESIWLNVVGGGAPTIAIIRGKQFYLSFENSAVISVQNRTLAGVTAGATDEDELATNVTNNPLVGKIYQGKGNSFIPKWRPSGDLSYEGFVGDRVTGLIKTTAANSIPEQLTKPPPATFFKGCRRYSKVILNPGNIKQVRVASKFGMSLTKFFERLSQTLSNASVNSTTGLGNVLMIGLEKVLDSGSDEFNMALGFETNHILKCSGRYRKQIATAPLIEVIP